MSHPIPGHDFGEPTNESAYGESEGKDLARHMDSRDKSRDKKKKMARRMKGGLVGNLKKLIKESEDLRNKPFNFKKHGNR